MMKTDRISLLNSIANSHAAEASRQVYQTGDEVPESGIYRVTHAAHRLPHEVTLLRGESFPRCCKCGSAVIFEVAQLAPLLSEGRNIVLYELPEVEAEMDSSVA